MGSMSTKPRNNISAKPEIIFEAFGLTDLEHTCSLLADWHKQPHVQQHCPVDKLTNSKSIIDWIDSHKNVNFSLFRYNGKPLGYASVGYYNGVSAEFGFVIGENDYINKGIGKEAMRFFLRGKFATNAYELFYAFVYSNNTRCLSAISSIGFTIRPTTNNFVYCTITKGSLR